MYPKNDKVYAAYEGDEFICMGSIKEVSTRMCITEDAVRWHIRQYSHGLVSEVSKKFIFCLDEGMDEE